MLAVVEEQQCAALAEVFANRRQRLVERLQPEPECIDDGGADEGRIRERPELDDEHAVGELGATAPGNFERQPSLASPSGASQGYQSVVALHEQGDDLVDLEVAAYQAGWCLSRLARNGVWHRDSQAAASVGSELSRKDDWRSKRTSEGRQPLADTSYVARPGGSRVIRMRAK